MQERLNIKEILNRTTEHFEEYGIQTPRLDAEVLLSNLLGIERIELYVNFDRPLEKEEIDEYRQRVIERSKHIPVAYIIGHWEFMSLDFKVNQDVLIPRPETEHLVETISQHIRDNTKESLTVVDLCTGSGAVIISLAVELKDTTKQINYIATDISEEALKIAKENAKHHGVIGQIKFLQGDLLKPIKNLDEEVDILLSNPPYIPDEELQQLQPELEYEPEIALKGGEDGLEFYRRIIDQSANILAEDGLVALEVGDQQATDVQKLLLKKNFTRIKVLDDYAEIPRVVLGHNNLED
ncbi:peptide chain release factor N(5)-glutamine methyltransferase [Selenihalanaerobacter shriftii]|uniref:Release factor glutamine methyltransferase n=1 Tax=Selenihalanaerobacter shriftii TaxID=142842 RepID=A0A1T4L124_9FIRM|nr:peptide chain release factor N(5)-glutamine methyltransferase [Selenihalanaerobacter shriftii]SJZ48405.1 release factor glutamine methyltransferase [Selenihalanaerobacter shriftii]